MVIDENMKVVFCEFIGNLVGNVVDIKCWVDIVYEVGVLFIVDNIVVILVLCCVFDYGVDIVVYLFIKYIGGYGIIIGGIIVDLGKFDWVVYVDRFSMLIILDFSYYGVIYIEVFGLVVYIGCCCVVLFCNIGVVFLV